MTTKNINKRRPKKYSEQNQEPKRQQQHYKLQQKYMKRYITTTLGGQVIEY